MQEERGTKLSVTVELIPGIIRAQRDEIQDLMLILAEGNELVTLRAAQDNASWLIRTPEAGPFAVPGSRHFGTARDLALKISAWCNDRRKWSMPVLNLTVQVFHDDQGVIEEVVLHASGHRPKDKKK